jgi:hypothetical protein
VFSVAERNINGVFLYLRLSYQFTFSGGFACRVLHALLSLFYPRDIRSATQLYLTVVTIRSGLQTTDFNPYVKSLAI